MERHGAVGGGGAQQPTAPGAPGMPAGATGDAPAFPANEQSNAALRRAAAREARFTQLAELDSEQLAAKIVEMEFAAKQEKENAAAQARKERSRWVGHFKRQRATDGVAVWVDGAGQDNLGRPFVRPVLEDASPNTKEKGKRSIELRLGFIEMRKKRGLAGADGSNEDCMYKALRADIDLLHDSAYDGACLQAKVRRVRVSARGASRGVRAFVFGRADARSRKARD